MGGRGASSMGGRYGLPKNARAVSIVDKDGRMMTFYKSSSGVLLRSHTASGFNGSPVGSGNIGDIYRNAKKQGYSVSLISKSEFDKNTARQQAAHEESLKEVAYGETHPGAGRTGIPAKRLVYRPRRK